MITTLDVSDAYLDFDNREDCTLRSQSAPDAYTDYLITSAGDNGGGALKRAMTQKEVLQGEGRFTGKETVWIIFMANLGSAPAPKVGDIIKSIPQSTSEDGVEYKIVEVDTFTWKTRYKCITSNSTN